MGRVKATLPTSASATLVAIPAPTTSTAAQEAAETSTTTTTDTALEPKPYSPSVTDAVFLPTTPPLRRSVKNANCAPDSSGVKHGGSSLTASSATTAMKYPRVVLLTSFIVASQAWDLRGSSAQEWRSTLPTTRQRSVVCDDHCPVRRHGAILMRRSTLFATAIARRSPRMFIPCPLFYRYLENTRQKKKATRPRLACSVTSRPAVAFAPR
jgi:hypothetical protein